VDGPSHQQLSMFDAHSRLLLLLLLLLLASFHHVQ
jgi:hypothetical protein